jgi:hypothetical protein
MHKSREICRTRTMLLKITTASLYQNENTRVNTKYMLSIVILVGPLNFVLLPQVMQILCPKIAFDEYHFKL